MQLVISAECQSLCSWRMVITPLNFMLWTEKSPYNLHRTLVIEISELDSIGQSVT